MTSAEIKEIQRLCSTRSERIGIEMYLSRQEIEIMIERIMERLYDNMDQEYNPYGIDYRTLINSYPRQARVMYRLREQWTHVF